MFDNIECICQGLEFVFLHRWCPHTKS